MQLDHDKIMNFKYSYIRTLSSFNVGENKGLTEKELDELIEARFFDESGEYKIIVINGEPKIYESKDGTDLIDRTFRIENEKAFGKSITVRQTIGRDEDGQAYIKSSRLLGWEA